MDHAEARDQLEWAALEPGGIDRLLGAEHGDGLAIREHLAACPECRRELESLRASVSTIRQAVQLTPDPGLRARTLAQVSRLGRSRSATAQPSPAAVPAPAPPSSRWPSLVGAATFVAGVAASALLAGLIVWRATDARLTAADASLAEQRTTIAGLGIISDWTLRLSGDPAATHVRLTAADGGAQAGSVLLSATGTELVMVASGLSPPPGGREFRCWVEVAGEQVTIGRMYRAGELAYWVGELSRPILDGELRFGVTLVDSATDGLSGEVVLIGET